MEPDLIVSCPYNPTHRIRKSKFMSHVSKCKKTSNTANKVECPLDKTHIVDRDHLKEHIASCSSLGKLMDIGYDKPKEAELPIFMDTYNSTENWEEEPQVPSYKPMEVSAKKPVIRSVSGLTKSEKRKFKENERMRMANLKGFHSASAASSSVRDTVDEVPLRPPRNVTVSPTRISQDDDKNTQMYDHNVNMQGFIPEFHNNSFHKMLYDELAPEDDSIKQLEQSLRNTDTKISLRDYFQHVSRGNGNFPISDKKQEKVQKNETDVTSQMFNIDKKKETTENVASTSDTKITDKLLALLKNESSVKKIQPMKETIKIGRMNENLEKESEWVEVLSKFNERLTYLTDIQNAAAEESARILEQLKELKMREEINSGK